MKKLLLILFLSFSVFIASAPTTVSSSLAGGEVFWVPEEQEEFSLTEFATDSQRVVCIYKDSNDRFSYELGDCKGFSPDSSPQEGLLTRTDTEGHYSFTIPPDKEGNLFTLYNNSKIYHLKPAVSRGLRSKSSQTESFCPSFAWYLKDLLLFPVNLFMFLERLFGLNQLNNNFNFAVEKYDLRSDNLVSPVRQIWRDNSIYPFNSFYAAECDALESYLLSRLDESVRYLDQTFSEDDFELFWLRSSNNSLTDLTDYINYKFYKYFFSNSGPVFKDISGEESFFITNNIHFIDPKQKWIGSDSERKAQAVKFIKTTVKNSFSSPPVVYLNFKTSSPFWSYDESAYYSYDLQNFKPNLAVTIIGYDDFFPASKFKKNYKKPNKNGAFIAKTSLGKNFGLNGYMYISYEDESLINFPFHYYEGEGNPSPSKVTFPFENEAKIYQFVKDESNGQLKVIVELDLQGLDQVFLSELGFWTRFHDTNIKATGLEYNSNKELIKEYDLGNYLSINSGFSKQIINHKLKVNQEQNLKLRVEFKGEKIDDFLKKNLAFNGISLNSSLKITEDIYNSLSYDNFFSKFNFMPYFYSEANNPPPIIGLVLDNYFFYPADLVLLKEKAISYLNQLPAGTKVSVFSTVFMDNSVMVPFLELEEGIDSPARVRLRGIINSIIPYDPSSELTLNWQLSFPFVNIPNPKNSNGFEKALESLEGARDELDHNSRAKIVFFNNFYQVLPQAKYIDPCNRIDVDLVNRYYEPKNYAQTSEFANNLLSFEAELLFEIFIAKTVIVNSSRAFSKCFESWLYVLKNSLVEVPVDFKPALALMMEYEVMPVIENSFFKNSGAILSVEFFTYFRNGIRSGGYLDFEGSLLFLDKIFPPDIDYPMEVNAANLKIRAENKNLIKVENFSGQPVIVGQAGSSSGFQKRSGNSNNVNNFVIFKEKDKSARGTLVYLYPFKDGYCNSTDQVLLKVAVSENGQPGLDKVVKVEMNSIQGDFLEGLELFDNGLGGDELAEDGIYSAYCKKELIPGHKYIIKPEAFFGSKSVGGDSQFLYVINPAQDLVTKEISLTLGWNMVSLPVDPLNQDNLEDRRVKKASAVFPEAKSVWEYHHDYNESLQKSESKYTLVFDESSGVDKEVSVGGGYFVYMDSPQKISVSGLICSGYLAELHPGWNLIGTIGQKGEVSKTAFEMFGGADLVYDYNPETKEYRLLYNGEVNEHLTEGRAVWVRVENGSLEVIRSSN